MEVHHDMPLASASTRNDNIRIEPSDPNSIGHIPRVESPRPLSSEELHGHVTRQNTAAGFESQPPRQSGLEWILPVEPRRRETINRLKTLQERIDPTLQHAISERDRYEFKAKFTGYALNIAIGCQVALGALTTGLSAATSGRETSIAISVIGAFSTIVASYLARARGTNEPELSTIRARDLNQFIRECQVFVMDYGHLTGNEHDSQLNALRDRFGELLGNANGERRLASV
ncbi:carbamoyl-phosphate synth [Favolaschia claudopus]|uniref:Carbamoyl-phosphate synth n=1 Tax=Favolaschia claudopus TaxID=2862362 RepID=A0AAV9ZCQ0_9AGAR